jgi:hypothetical protein
MRIGRYDEPRAFSHPCGAHRCFSIDEWGAWDSYSSMCQGVRMRGPLAVTATVNSKWAAREPSSE